MRSSGVRGLLIYCADYKCSHWIRIRADQWSADVRLSDLDDRFTCTASVRSVLLVGPSPSYS
jgi:hypothetical protein